MAGDGTSAPRMNGNGEHRGAPSPSSSSRSSRSSMSEESPLLRALNDGQSSSDGTYMAIPRHVQTTNARAAQSGMYSDAYSGMGPFRPIMYAEKALASLLYGVLVYIFCCLLGLFLTSLNFEGLLLPQNYTSDSAHIQYLAWWVVFLPFWIGNGILSLAHVTSIKHVKQLRMWAEIEYSNNVNPTSSNGLSSADANLVSQEPLLPLLKRILVIYAVTVPLALLLLWSEIAFCVRLSEGIEGMGSLYVGFVPLIIIQAAFLVRYLLCRSDSFLPGLCWLLVFVFSTLVSYQIEAYRLDHSYPLAWTTVCSPLMALEVIMALCLALILQREFAGVYRLSNPQLVASVLYLLALVTGGTGQVFILMATSSTSSLSFPYALVFFALGCVSVSIYMVSKQHIDHLLATRGGAVPVPLQRTNEGWITGPAALEQWVLFGDVALTEDGLRSRQTRRGRINSAVDDEKETGVGQRLLRWVNEIWSQRGGSQFGSSQGDLSPNDPERRLHNMMHRSMSGSYSDIAVDVTTPKT